MTESVLQEHCESKQQRAAELSIASMNVPEQVQLSPNSPIAESEKHRFIRNFLSKGNLVLHASTRNDLKILKPRTRNRHNGAMTRLLYATCSLELAMMHGIKKRLQTRHACILNRYRCFGFSFVFCSVLKKKAKEIMDTPITLYACEKRQFERSHLRKRMDLLSLGLMRNTADVWVSQETVTPVFKTQLSLSDIDCTKYLHDDGDSRIMTLLKRERV